MKAHRFKFFLVCIVGLAALGLATMLLWNWLIPAIFTLGTITYWQALGLMALGRLLVGGFGKGGHGGHHGGRRMRKKWMSMTAEQRAEFMRSHHPFCRPATPPQQPQQE